MNVNSQMEKEHSYVQNWKKLEENLKDASYQTLLCLSNAKL